MTVNGTATSTVEKEVVKTVFEIVAAPVTLTVWVRKRDMDSVSISDEKREKVAVLGTVLTMVVVGVLINSVSVTEKNCVCVRESGM